MDHKLLTFIPKLYLPRKMFFGTKSSAYLKTLDDQPRLAVVSAGFAAANPGNVSTLIGDLDRIEVTGEPTTEALRSLVERCRQASSKTIIAIGGGSVIDLAKLAAHECSVPLVAIPTTIGAGAEVSQHAVLIDPATRQKKVTSTSAMLPDTVIIDPSLVATLPTPMIVQQAIDAIAHAIEALVSRLASPFTDMLALAALPQLVPTLEHLETKPEITTIERLQQAGILAGLAQSSAATGLAHAFAHYLGPRLPQAHAALITRFLPDILDFNATKTAVYSKLQGLNWTIDELSHRLRRVATTHGLNSQPLLLSEPLEQAAAGIRQDVCATTNPCPATAEDISRILRSHVG